MIYVVFANDCHDVKCVRVDTNETREAIKLTKEAWGGYLDCMCFAVPPLDAIVQTLEEIHH